MATRKDNTTIYITKGVTGIGYQYHDEVKRSKDSSHVIAWHGQRKGGKDKHVGIGSGVFYRKIADEPFTWIGRIYKKELLREGDINNDQPAVYLLIVPFDKDTFRTFSAEEKGSGCYKKAAQQGMGYTLSKDFLSGIICHT